MRSNAIVIYTKLPKAGFVKTRLSSGMSEEEILNYQIAMMKDVRAASVSIDADLFVYYYDDEEEDPENPGLSEEMEGLMKKIFPKNWTFERQYGDSEAERLAGTFLSIFKKRYHSCVLLTSDVPEIRYYQIQDAFEKLVPDMFREEEPLDSAFGLDRAKDENLVDVVLGPSGKDFYLLGVTDKLPYEVLERMLSVPIHCGWDSLSHCKKVLENEKLTMELLEERPIVLTMDDVEQYQERMKKKENDFLRQKFCGRCLRQMEAVRNGLDPDKIDEEEEKKGIWDLLMGGFGRGKK